MDAIHNLDIDNTGAKPITLDPSMVGGGLSQADDGVISGITMTDIVIDVSSEFSVVSGDKSYISVSAFQISDLVFVAINCKQRKTDGGNVTGTVKIPVGLIPSDFYVDNSTGFVKFRDTLYAETTSSLASVCDYGTKASPKFSVLFQAYAQFSTMSFFYKVKK